MGKLSRLVVQADGWQVLLVFLGAMLFYGIVPDQQHVLKIVASILLAVVIFGWFLVVGTSLNENLPEDQQKPDTLFTISCFYAILLVSASALLNDVEMDEDAMVYAIALVISFGASFFYMIYFTSVLFTSNQEHFKDKEKLSAEVTFVLFVTFILGVLVLQNRIKRFFAEP